VRVCIRAGDTGDDFGKANCVRNYIGLTHAAPSIMDHISVPAISRVRITRKKRGPSSSFFLSSLSLLEKKGIASRKMRAISTNRHGKHPGKVKGEQDRRSIIAKGIRESETLYFGRVQ